MKFFIIAGEASGDVHGANLVKELKKLYPDATFSGTGGPNLKELGQHQYFTAREMAIIGFVEVLKKAPLIFSLFKTIKKAVIKEEPDVVILIDYPGFNLRMAKILKKLGKKVIYFISPQFWVWNYKRIYTLRDYTDLTISILPFEMQYLEKENVKSVYVGNPIIDNFKFRFDNKEEFLKHLNFSGNRKIIGILPGSREREIVGLMESFISAAKNYDDIDFVISKADSIDMELLKKYVPEKSNFRILEKAQYDIIKHSDFLWACSGTITLEASVFEKPMIIVYTTSKLNIVIAKMVSKLRVFGLPNIMQGKEFLPEVHCIGDLKQRTERIIEGYNKALENIDSIKEELSKISVQFLGKTPSKTAAYEISKIIG